jgi:hypothetical protein
LEREGKVTVREEQLDPWRRNPPRATRWERNGRLGRERGEGGWGEKGEGGCVEVCGMRLAEGMGAQIHDVDAAPDREVSEPSIFKCRWRHHLPLELYF